MAIMSPLLSVVGFSIKESFVAAEVNFMSDGTPSLACQDSYPKFYNLLEVPYIPIT